MKGIDSEDEDPARLNRNERGMDIDVPSTHTISRQGTSHVSFQYGWYL